MGERAIEVRGLGKRYTIGQRGSYDTLREALTRIGRRRNDEASQEAAGHWALRDVSLDVDRGEVLGVVGRNGAGKSTLLKLISRITEPSEGVCRTRGRVGAILDVGTGFHPELTGAENIVLGAAVLGASRRETMRRFDDIVAFADVEKYMATPLKRYSTGMRLRLAFAVAAYVEPDILAVDEVLAVGDAEFQKRCLSRISEFSGEGRTVVFVSHDHGAVTRLCSRAIWIERGQIVADGAAADVVARYLRSAASSALMSQVDLEVPSGAPAAIRSILLRDETGDPAVAVERGRPLELELELAISAPTPGLDIAVFILDAQGQRLIDEAWMDQPGRPLLEPGRTTLRVHLHPHLSPGAYLAGIWVGDSVETYQEREAMPFEVLPRPEDPIDGRRRVLQPPVSWATATPRR